MLYAPHNAVCTPQCWLACIDAAWLPLYKKTQHTTEWQTTMIFTVLFKICVQNVSLSNILPTHIFIQNSVLSKMFI